MKRGLGVALLAAGCIATACGGSTKSDKANGAVVFARDCSSCHSLIGNESRHTAGGDLLGYSFSRAILLQYASEMPTPSPLTPAQLQAVVNHVLRAERRAAHER